jgi:hypothetical protein
VTVERLTRRQVLRFRMQAQQLQPPPEATARPAEPAVLDLGLQDTGPIGALWALAGRGADVTAAAFPDELSLVWTIRGAPHVHRRSDLPAVSEAVRPYSHPDAARRIIGAAAPLKDAGIPAGEAMAVVGAAMRDVVRGPTVKGTVSGALTPRLDPPYVRWCEPCGATHVYEMPFRLAALHAGLELEAGTSPPVLRPIPEWDTERLEALRSLPQAEGEEPSGAPPRLDLVRGYLHLLGPATDADVAGYLEASPRDVAVRWARLEKGGALVEADVDGRSGWLLEEDAHLLATEPASEPVVHLLGPFDPFLQARDRELLVPDRAHRKALWPTLGRPGAVLHEGEVVGTWRPRTKGRRLTVEVERWTSWTRSVKDGVAEQVERLGTFRGLPASVA